jgi:hypothetical protein
MCCACGGGDGGDGVVNPFIDFASHIKSLDQVERAEYFTEIKASKLKSLYFSPLDKMQSQGIYNMAVLLNLGYFNENTREWLSLGTTMETSFSIIGVGDLEWSFGVTAINAGGSSGMSTIDGCAGGTEQIGDLTTPYNMVAVGECDDYDGDGVEDNALTWTWDDDNYEACGEGYVQDCVDADCCYEGWIGDGLCDGVDQVSK